MDKFQLKQLTAKQSKSIRKLPANLFLKIFEIIRMKRCRSGNRVHQNHGMSLPRKPA